MMRRLLISWLLYIIVISLGFAYTEEALQTTCGSLSSCFSCLDPALSNECAWCTMSSSCVNSTQECENWTVDYVGSLGKGSFAKLYSRDEYVVNNCEKRIERVDSCVSGSQFAQLYLPYSESVRNAKEGGFDDQPTLAVPQEFINKYVSESFDGSNKLIKELRKYNYTAHVGSFVMTRQHSNITKGLYEPTTYTSSSLLGIRPMRANYSVDSESGKLMVELNSRSDKILYHILLTNTGLIASPGSYQVGFVFLLHNESHYNHSSCLFYQSPRRVKVYRATKDILLGPYLYMGVPMFLITHIILVLFAKFCPWSHTKHLADSLRDQKQKQLESDYLQSKRDTAIANEEDIGDISDEYVLHPRVGFNVWWFIRMNSVRLVKQCGFQAYYHWKFYRRCIFLLALIGILVICTLIPIHVTQYHKSKSRIYPDFAITTAATLKKDSTIAVVHYVLSIGIYLISVVNIILVLRLIFFKKKQAKQAFFTAHLTNLPDLVLTATRSPDLDVILKNKSEVLRRQKLLKHHYDSIIKQEHEIRYAKAKYEGKDIPSLDSENVLSVNVIADIAHLIPLIDAQHTIETQLKDTSDVDPRVIERRLKRLDDVREQLFTLASQKPIISNSAFVTFRSVQGLRSCVKLHERKEDCCTPHSLKFSDTTEEWKLSEITWEPEEILWENICISKTSTAVRVIIVYIMFMIVFVLMFLFVITFVITGGFYNLAIGLHLTQSIAEIRQSKNKFVMGIVTAMTWLANRLPLVVAILVEITGAITYNITKIEKMKTIARYQASTLCKTLCIMALLACWVPYFEDRALIHVSSYIYYNSTVMKLTQFILAQLFVSRSFKHLGKIIMVIISYFRTKGEPRRLEFDFITSYSKAIVVFFIVLTSCTKIPLLVVPGIIFMIVSYISDSFLLAFFYEKSNVTGTAEIGILSILMVYSAVSSVIAAPQINWTIRTILSSTFVGFTLTVTILLVCLFLFIKWAARRKLKYLMMKNEDIFANNYAQPHLQMLLRDEPFKVNTPKAQPIIAFEECSSPTDFDPMIPRI